MVLHLVLKKKKVTEIVVCMYLQHSAWFSPGVLASSLGLRVSLSHVSAQ